MIHAPRIYLALDNCFASKRWTEPEEWAGIIAGLGMIQMALILLVTSRWKISGHGVAIGGITVFAVGIFGREAWPLLLAIPLVAWARVRLKRHTLAQTVAGSLLGIAMTLLLLQLL